MCSQLPAALHLPIHHQIIYVLHAYNVPYPLLPVEAYQRKLSGSYLHLTRSIDKSLDTSIWLNTLRSCFNPCKDLASFKILPETSSQPPGVRMLISSSQPSTARKPIQCPGDSKASHIARGLPQQQIGMDERMDVGENDSRKSIPSISGNSWPPGALSPR